MFLVTLDHVFTFGDWNYFISRALTPTFGHSESSGSNETLLEEHEFKVWKSPWSFWHSSTEMACGCGHFIGIHRYKKKKTPSRCLSVPAETTQSQWWRDDQIPQWRLHQVPEVHPTRQHVWVQQTDAEMWASVSSLDRSSNVLTVHMRLICLSSALSHSQCRRGLSSVWWSVWVLPALNRWLCWYVNTYFSHSHSDLLDMK